MRFLRLHRQPEHADAQPPKSLSSVLFRLAELLRLDAAAVELPRYDDKDVTP